MRIFEGETYEKTVPARYKNGRINYNKICVIGTDNKWIKFTWDTGSLTMRLDKYIQIAKV